LNELLGCDFGRQDTQPLPNRLQLFNVKYKYSFVDRHRLDADPFPDLTFLFDPDPYPDPTFLFDPDPYQDPTSI
jgi:hypothetical protein